MVPTRIWKPRIRKGKSANAPEDNPTHMTLTVKGTKRNTTKMRTPYDGGWGWTRGPNMNTVH